MSSQSDSMLTDDVIREALEVCEAASQGPATWVGFECAPDVHELDVAALTASDGNIASQALDRFMARAGSLFTLSMRQAGGDTKVHEVELDRCADCDPSFACFTRRQPDEARAQMDCIKMRGCTVAITGNGPTSGANARFIAAALHPTLGYAAALRELLDRRKPEVHIYEQLRVPRPGTTDACQFCGGAKGGEPGNENLIGGVTICDDCTALYRKMRAADQVALVDPELDALVRTTTDRAREHERQEAVGERIGLVTPAVVTPSGELGATVTDKDELEMYKAMAAQNIAVCPTCMNTGWENEDGGIVCKCPAGRFLSKKLLDGAIALERASRSREEP